MIDRADLRSIPEALRLAAQRRTDDVLRKLTAAMSVMEQEQVENDGIYPRNRGRINQAEVCRRAQVAKVTLQGPSHKLTTKILVDNWVRSRSIVKISEVRKAVSNRAERWKADHDSVASHYAVAMLELVEAQNRVLQLLSENAALREQLHFAGGGKIAVLHPTGARAHDQ